MSVSPTERNRLAAIYEYIRKDYEFYISVLTAQLRQLRRV